MRVTDSSWDDASDLSPVGLHLGQCLTVRGYSFLFVCFHLSAFHILTLGPHSLLIQWVNRLNCEPRRRWRSHSVCRRCCTVCTVPHVRALKTRAWDEIINFTSWMSATEKDSHWYPMATAAILNETIDWLWSKFRLSLNPKSSTEVSLCLSSFSNWKAAVLGWDQVPDVAIEEDRVSLRRVAFVVRLIVRLHSDALSDQSCSVCLSLSRAYSPAASLSDRIISKHSWPASSVSRVRFLLKSNLAPVLECNRWFAPCWSSLRASCGL